ncbi:acyl-CoA dehydrogenase family protein, partial [Escherichia coli]|uniref:acyl-CoA dehydrogenase family protein n=1 Tax=Escherichia coli TaxID=562 RepID=UPI0039E19E51
MSSAFDPARFLPDDLLARLRERAPVHDRDNTFPDADLDDLRTAGYLGILSPEDFGGAGLSLAEAAVLQQRLAGAAPATALAV